MCILVNLSKIKAKIKRKAHALVRWRKRHDYDPRFAVRALIKRFNKKFFDSQKAYI